jgi:hypothetical protein
MRRSASAATWYFTYRFHGFLPGTTVVRARS